MIGKVGNILERLTVELRPIDQTAGHDARVDEIEVVGWEGPFLLGVVNFEL